MDAWNWLMDLYEQNIINIEYLEESMKDDRKARELYDEFRSYISIEEKISYIREEIEPFLEYLKNKSDLPSVEMEK